MADRTEPLPRVLKKAVFDSEALARAAALLAEMTYGQDLHIYQCQYCMLWHISSK